MATIKLDTSQEVTFASSTTLSSSIRLGDSGTLEAIETSTGWNRTTLTLLASIDNTTFKKLNDAGGDRVVALEVTSNTFIAFNGAVTKGINFLKFERASSETDAITVKVIIRHDGA